MKRTLLLVSLSFVLSANVSFSQETSSSSTKTSTVSSDITKNTSAIKPADGKPYVFSTRESLESSVPAKINGLKDQILSGKLTEAQVTELREQIWRLENATISK